MHFLLKINWQIFRILLFYDYFILSEDLVIEIEGVLQRRILIEIAAERKRETLRAALSLAFSGSAAS
jgi:hypothetical protein